MEISESLVKPDTRPGRPARKAGDSTRERMLDAAEKLFAEHGFQGTSMRDIAGVAGARLALVTYHFGTKDALFARVVERRSFYMNSRRIAALDEARKLTDDGPAPIRLLVEGYIWPFLERWHQGGPGWMHYSTLIARLATSPMRAKVISEYYDAVSRQYIIEFRRALGDAAEEDVYHAFNFMVGVMLAAVSEPDRVEKLSRGKVSASDVDGMFKTMSRFVEAGFAAIAVTAPARG
ncbi:MAG: TetR/AcrR family transcriptional regulator [Janthinobacterium lividum]